MARRGSMEDLPIQQRPPGDPRDSGRKRTHKTHN